MNVQLPVHMDKTTFLAWIQGREERFELAQGRVVMMTGGTIRHALIVGNLYALLRATLDKKRWMVLADFGIDAGPDTVRYPDVIVHPRIVKGTDLIVRTPVLAIEVLSPSTMKTDLGDKAAEYLQLPSLAAYLVFAQDEVKAWAYVRGTEQAPLGPRVVAGMDESIAIPALGIDLALANVYADVELD